MENRKPSPSLIDARDRFGWTDAAKANGKEPDNFRLSPSDPHDPSNVRSFVSTTSHGAPIDARNRFGPCRPEQASDLLFSVMFELHSRVDQVLALQLTKNECKALEDLAERDDPEASIEWLAEHCPEHNRIVHNELEVLVRELRSIADELASTL